MKTTKGGKVMNPTDAFRKEQRKREIKRNKKERQKVREVGILKKDPEQIKEQIRKLDMSKAEGALDKARKHKKRQLEDTLKMVVKKRKEYDEKKKEQGEATTSVMFSHLPPQRRATGEEDLKPEDSVYYHPTLNPTGATLPGKPPMYNSSIGTSISSDGAASSSGAALSSITDSEDSVLVAPPPLPPLPPLPDGNNTLAASLPPTTGVTLPHPLFPPPPPGPPPKEQDLVRPPLPPGLSGNEDDGRFPESSDLTFNNRKNANITSVPPPPPPGLPSGPPSNESESVPSECNESSFQNAKMVAPPPPPPLHQQHQSTFAGGAPSLTSFQTDVHLPPGMRFPPPPPPLDMHPGMLGGHHIHHIPRPPFGPPPGPPTMVRPPLPPGPPPSSYQDGQAMIRPYVPNKPSYVKSAAPTVVRRPLAQHTPELTSMVPASVRVKRESLAVTKPKPKTSMTTSLGFRPRAIASAAPVKVESAKTSAASKPQSIDDSYTAFLEDMKALGALDG
ncbi:PREDICTED: WW domain-binding protein 11 [Camelina sativa]|uniref:WW domain-binding protein 11 n=1 Tax=Camelina sativa TaxID=90675 RepID=A0ABM0XCP6_CAMSA|nr:PREDICTED: WW domain-binding protein 11 [Camelina sativa]